mmetsp:Transcript_102919/g.266055  ORF Transcript_102919/g.266055 Transcript_102919/m.266055 type:complete len:282 (+) Transcript_102919:614-1459(+)
MDDADDLRHGLDDDLVRLHLGSDVLRLLRGAHGAGAADRPADAVRRLVPGRAAPGALRAVASGQRDLPVGGHLPVPGRDGDGVRPVHDGGPGRDSNRLPRDEQPVCHADTHPHLAPLDLRSDLLRADRLLLTALPDDPLHDAPEIRLPLRQNGVREPDPGADALHTLRLLHVLLGHPGLFLHGRIRGGLRHGALVQPRRPARRGGARPSLRRCRRVLRRRQVPPGHHGAGRAAHRRHAAGPAGGRHGHLLCQHQREPPVLGHQLRLQAHHLLLPQVHQPVR